MLNIIHYNRNICRLANNVCVIYFNYLLIINKQIIHLLFTLQIIFSDITKRPQLAGTEVDLEIATYVRDEWRRMGIEANLVNYTVLLSYPNATSPNIVNELYLLINHLFATLYNY